MIEGVPIRGLVIGQQGIDIALVQIASEAEIAALARAHANVAVTPVAAEIPGELDLTVVQAMIAGDAYVRMPDGSFRRVGVFTDVQTRHNVHDMTSFRDSERRFVRGFARMTFTGEGPT